MSIMPVQIVPVGLLKPHIPGCDTVTLESGAGKTIEQVLGELRVELDLVAMVLVNGRQAPLGTLLQDGDVVKLIPFVGGG